MEEAKGTLMPIVLSYLDCTCELNDVRLFPSLAATPFLPYRTSVYSPPLFGQCIFHRHRFIDSYSNLLSYGKNQTQDTFSLESEGKIISL